MTDDRIPDPRFREDSRGQVRVWRAGFDAADDKRLLHLWRQGYDTVTIAGLMMRSEAEVHNRLIHIRGPAGQQR